MRKRLIAAAIPLAFVVSAVAPSVHARAESSVPSGSVVSVTTTARSPLCITKVWGTRAGFCVPWTL